MQSPHTISSLAASKHVQEVRVAEELVETIAVCGTTKPAVRTTWLRVLRRVVFFLLPVSVAMNAPWHLGAADPTLRTTSEPHQRRRAHNKPTCAVVQIEEALLAEKARAPTCMRTREAVSD